MKKPIYAVKFRDFLSLRRTAEAYDIPLTTLRRRLAGGIFCALGCESQQLLTVAEEIGGYIDWSSSDFLHSPKMLERLLPN